MKVKIPMVFSGFELGLNVLTVGWNDVLAKLAVDNPLKIAFEAFINNFLGMYKFVETSNCNYRSGHEK